MTALMTSPTPIGAALQARRLPRWTPFAVGGGAIVASYLLFGVAHLLGGGLVLVVVGAILLFLLGTAVAATFVEGSRAARNRVATALIYSAFTLALLPLLSVVLTLLEKGTSRLDSD